MSLGINEKKFKEDTIALGFYLVKEGWKSVYGGDLPYSYLVWLHLASNFLVEQHNHIRFKLSQSLEAGNLKFEVVEFGEFFVINFSQDVIIDKYELNLQTITNTKQSYRL